MPFLEEIIQQGTRRLLSACHRAGESCGDRDHRQGFGENINRRQLGRASRAGRHRGGDAYPYGAGEERTHQGLGLLPLRARHNRCRKSRRLRFPKTSESRPRGVHPGAYPDCQRDVHPRPRGQRPVGMD